MTLSVCTLQIQSDEDYESTTSCDHGTHQPDRLVLVQTHQRVQQIQSITYTEFPLINFGTKILYDTKNIHGHKKKKWPSTTMPFSCWLWQ